MSTRFASPESASSLIVESPQSATFRFPLPESITERLESYARLTSLPFMCVDSKTLLVLAKTDDELLEIVPDSVIARLMHGNSIQILETPSELVYYSLPIPEAAGLKTWAIGYALARENARPNDIIVAAAAQGWSHQFLDEWLSRQPHCAPDLLQRLLALAWHVVGVVPRERTMQAEIDKLGAEIEHTYEEISLLHSLARNLQISQSPIELARLCLNRMEELIPAEGSMIWLQERNGRSDNLVHGDLPLNGADLQRLLNRFEDHNWTRPLVRNHLNGSLLDWDFPGLRNFVVAAIAEGSHRCGWILFGNLRDGRDFGTVEASLMNSVATILGTHHRNIDLYEQHEELFLAFVQSLISTLDAKDPYTRGHSERVALVARRLGEQFGLSENDCDDIYQSGLLHDVGKIGIDESILRKPGRLTDEEFAEIKRHPMIGYSILSGLTNMRRLLPGVRNHHENYDGTGYPDGLKGEAIPLMARVLAVADSYDAMGSDRPYRPGMPLEKLEEIFRNGAGSQWDEKVISAYFAARDDVRRIWQNFECRQLLFV